MTRLKLLLISFVFSFLAACGGGGGGGGGTVASANTFDIQAGWSRLVANGFTSTFTVSGTCSGTFNLTDGAANTSTTFEGAPAISGNSVISMTLSTSGCTPSTASTETRYYDSNYNLLGYSVLGGSYGVWVTPPTFSNTARVGDVVVVGTVNKYTNSTKSTSAGRQENSYVIEPDTATTAITNLITKNYNTSNALTSTEQDRYRIAADGSLTLISIDIQYANGSTTHLVMN